MYNTYQFTVILIRASFGSLRFQASVVWSASPFVARPHAYHHTDHSVGPHSECLEPQNQYETNTSYFLHNPTRIVIPKGLSVLLLSTRAR